MALSAVPPCKDAPCANEMAGLRAFLRSRCGSLKGAFAELDSHDVGRLTSDDFVKGLQRLGYTEDASAFFRSMDSNKTGVLTLKSFMNCLGDRVFDTEVERPYQQSPTMSRSSSEDAWKSARIPKTPSSTPNLLTSVQVGNVLKSGSALRSSTPENSGLTSPKVAGADLSSTPNLLTSVPVGNVLKSGSALRSSTPENSGLASPHLPVAGADLLYARVSRVEEKVAAEQRARCETEQRLTQHLNSLVGVSISEQLDVLREQLVEERMQRQVEISAVRATIETIRSGSALRSSTSTPDNSSSHLPVAGADLLFGRMSRVEEQFATEQRLRSETEQRLTQHLNSLVGVIISEQVDILREQLVEERMQRQVESSALRTTIETVRSMALRSVQENLEECVKSEVDRSISEVRLSIGQSQFKKYPEEIAQKLDELGKSMEGRVSELEKSTASRASCAVRSEMQKIKQELDLSARRAADTSAASLAELDQRFHLLEEKLRAIDPQARSARDGEAASAQVQRQTTGPMPTSPPGANMVRSRSVAMPRGVEPGQGGSFQVKVAASPPVPGAPGAAGAAGAAGYPRNVRMVPAPQTQRPVSPTPASPQMQRSAPPPLESPYVHSRPERLPASSVLANPRRR